MEGIIRWARRYFLFENWTWDQPQVAARRRASWPRWRRAVRPVGAVAWRMGVALGLAFEPDNSAPLAVYVIGSLLVSVAICCALFGIVDGIRQRRAESRVRPT